MNFPHLAQRLFNRPLAILPDKAEIIMAALADRLGIVSMAKISNGQMKTVPMAYGDSRYNAKGRDRDMGYDITPDGIAVIEVSGTLVHKNGTLRPYSGMTGYDGIRENIFAAINDPEVKAICLDIDSPGGEVAGCFDLVDFIYEARKQKKIFAILNEIACSAAYAIASACNKIYMPRTGIAGSIGVIWMHVDWSKAMGESGVAVTFIKYGDRKADGNSYEPLADEARKRAQADIDSMGELFVRTVARNRGISADKIRATQAAVYLGQEAIDQNLVDGIMSPDAAYEAICQQI